MSDFPDWQKGVTILGGDTFALTAADFPDWTDGINVVDTAIAPNQDFPDWTKVVSQVANVNPPSSTTMVLWLDAHRITNTTDGTPLQTWHDNSSQANDFTQATLVNRPVYYSTTRGQLINGRAAVTFTHAVQSYMTATKNLGPLTPTFTVAVVAQNQDTTLFPVIVYSSDNVANSFYLQEQGSPGPYTFAVTGSAISAGTADTSPHVLIAEDLNRSSSLYLDGTLIAGPTNLGAFLNTNPVRTIIGNTSQLTPDNFLTGQIGELLVYMPALSSGDRTSLYDYLKAKWATP